MARIEEEAGCDVEAGFDWGHNADAYLVSAESYLDRAKLLALLREGLSSLLDAEEIDAMVKDRPEGHRNCAAKPHKRFGHGKAAIC